VKPSRRTLLAAGPLVLADLCSAASPKVYRVFVSSARAPGAGIYSLPFEPDSGQLSEPALASESGYSMYVAIHPSGRFLYSPPSPPNSRTPGAVQPEGSVIAFAIEGNGLRKLNQVPSGGIQPLQLVVDKTGRNLLVVNYTTGNTAVFRLKDDGSLGERTCLIQHTGSSVAPRQDAAHPHGVRMSASNRFAIASDLGSDRYIVYRFDAASGTIAQHSEVNVKAGSGPRHFSFHPDQKFAYGICELTSAINVFAWDEAAGRLTEIQTTSSLPDNGAGTNGGAEILAHPSGRFVYASNRSAGLAIFSVDRNKGALTLVGHAPTLGESVFSFMFDPSGEWMLVGNMATGNISVFRIDQATGNLKAQGEPVKIPSPSCIKFVEEK
jgi:6-phosphogluconolactonase